MRTTRIWNVVHTIYTRRQRGSGAHRERCCKSRTFRSSGRHTVGEIKSSLSNGIGTSACSLFWLSPTQAALPASQLGLGREIKVKGSRICEKEGHSPKIPRASHFSSEPAQVVRGKAWVVRSSARVRRRQRLLCISAV